MDTHTRTQMADQARHAYTMHTSSFMMTKIIYGECVADLGQPRKELSAVKSFSYQSQRTMTSSYDAACQQCDGDALQGLWNRKSPAHLHWSLVRQAHNNRSSLDLNSTYQPSVIPALDHLRFFNSYASRHAPSSPLPPQKAFEAPRSHSSASMTQQAWSNTQPQWRRHVCQNPCRWATPFGTTRKSRP